MKYPESEEEIRQTGGPAPHGAGGLKSMLPTKPMRNKKSRPPRGGWIEINAPNKADEEQKSPAPHGAGGLKF